MTLDISGYTVGSNRNLKHSRILWDPIKGEITGDGEGPELVATDYANQRWTFDTYPASLILETPADVEADTLFIVAHNLGSVGATVTLELSETTGGAFDEIAEITPQDNRIVAAMFNDAEGDPYGLRRYRITVSDGTGLCTIGIIRLGVAMQAERPVFGGVNPIGLNEEVEVESNRSERGQWLGRTTQMVSAVSSLPLTNLSDTWVREVFEPFRRVAVTRPFGVIQNPLRMPESIGWCWTDSSPSPENSGTRNLMNINIPLRGLVV